MDTIKECFMDMPSQEKVARALLKLGIRVEEDRAYCGDIEQNVSAIGRAMGVDRRVVTSTLQRISATPELGRMFSKASPILSLAELAPEIGCSAIKIIPTDATKSGILADVTAVLYRHGVSIRQITVDDGGTRELSTLTVVVDGQLPSETIPEIKGCDGVSTIIIL